MAKLNLIKTKDVIIANDAAETLLDLHDEVAIRLYIYLVQNGGSFDIGAAHTRLGVSQDKVAQALDLLTRKKLVTGKQEKVLERPDTLPEYTAGDIKNALDSDEKFKFVLESTQKKLGKILSTADTQALLGIYSWLGLPAEVICLIVTYCITESEKKYGKGRRPTMRTIESQAKTWYNLGILTTEQAEEYLRNLEYKGTKVAELTRLLHLGGRALAPTESRYINAWIDKNYPTELIMEAYDITVVRTNKLEWKFMNKVLENWEKEGCKAKADLEKEKKQGNVSAEQLAAYERLSELNKQWGSEEK